MNRNTKYNILSLIVFFSLLIHSEYSSAQSIKSSLDTNVILIGQKATFQLDIEYPGTDYHFPILQDSLVDKVEIQNIEIDSIKFGEQEKQFRIKYSISSFDSGFYQLPQQVLINSKTGDSIFSEALNLAVMTYAVDTTQKKIFDIKAPLESPLTFKEIVEEYWHYALISILIILGLFFAYRWYKKNKNKEQVKETKPVIPKEAAHVVALRELEALKDKKLWQNDRTKNYYVELSDIIRQYLERRFVFPAMESTSIEIIESSQGIKEIDSSTLAQLKQILSTADMVKFAKAQPLANENDLSMSNALEIVKKTQLEEKEAINSKEKEEKDV